MRLILNLALALFSLKSAVAVELAHSTDSFDATQKKEKHLRREGGSLGDLGPEIRGKVGY